jgi:hypothetical protein
MGAVASPAAGPASPAPAVAALALAPPPTLKLLAPDGKRSETRTIGDREPQLGEKDVTTTWAYPKSAGEKSATQWPATAR